MRVEPLPHNTPFALPAQQEPFVPSTPVLPPPEAPLCCAPTTYNGAIMSIIGTLEEIHTTGTNIHKTRSKEISRITTHLEEAQKQNLEKMKEIAEKTQQSGVWHVLQTIGSYILAGLHIVFGSLLVAQNAPLIGGIMIAAGLVSVANLAFSQSGFWSWVAKQIAKEDKELAKKLETIIPAVVGLIAAAAGFIGTYQVWEMANQLDLLQQALLVMQTTLGLMEGVSAIGQGFSDYSLKQSQAEQTTFQAAMAKDERALERVTHGMEKTVKILSDCTASASRMIRSTIYSNQKTAQI